MSVSSFSLFSSFSLSPVYLLPPPPNSQHPITIKSYDIISYDLRYPPPSPLTHFLSPSPDEGKKKGKEKGGGSKEEKGKSERKGN